MSDIKKNIKSKPTSLVLARIPKVGNIHTPTRKPRSPRHIDPRQVRSSQQDTTPPTTSQSNSRPDQFQRTFLPQRSAERKRDVVDKKQAGKGKENIVSDDKGVCARQNVTCKSHLPQTPTKKLFFPQMVRQLPPPVGPGSRQTLQVSRHMHGLPVMSCQAQSM